MKELDLLLESFLERNQQALESGSWPEFEALLHKVAYRGILERIRHGLG